MFWENMSNGLLTSASSNSREVDADVAVDDMDAHRALRLDLPGGRVSFVAAATPLIAVGLASALAVA